MTIIRPRQPALTNVLPHPGNRKYAIPRRWAGTVFRVLMTGDSFTDRSNVPAPYYSENLRYQPLTQYDDAEAGQLLSVLASGYAAALAANPDANLLLVQGGVNDLLSGAVTTLAGLTDSIEAINTDQDAAGITKRIFLDIAPFSGHSLWTPAMETIKEQYNAWLADRCAANNWVLVPMSTILADPNDATAINPDYDYGDGLHVNQAGAEHLALSVDGAIRALA